MSKKVKKTIHRALQIIVLIALLFFGAYNSMNYANEIVDTYWLQVLISIPIAIIKASGFLALMIFISALFLSDGFE